MITLLVVVALIALLFGGWGHHAHGADWNYMGWSPLGFILLVALVLWVGGYLR